MIHAELHDGVDGFRRGDGTALLQWLLDLTGDPDRDTWMSQARAPEQAAP